MEFQQGDKVAMGLEDVVTGETPAPDSAAKAMTMASKDQGSEDLLAAATAAAASAAAGALAEAAVGAESDSKAVHARRFAVVTDASRDALLTDFGKETLTDRYLLPGEGYQDLFARVADAYADDADHAQRLYDYISRLWFMPATPVLSNGGTGRGLPISLLSQFGVRQPRRDRQHLERECLAGQSRRRDRHLLGQCPRDWRAGWPERQDQRHHPFRAGDGFAHPGDFSRARCGAVRRPVILMSATRKSRSSSKSASHRAISTARR